MLGFSNDKHNVLLGKGYRIWGKSNPQGFSLMIAEDSWPQDPQNSWVHSAKTNTSLQQKDFQIFFIHSFFSYTENRRSPHIFESLFHYPFHIIWWEKSPGDTQRHKHEGRKNWVSIHHFYHLWPWAINHNGLISFFAKWVPSKVLWGLNDLRGEGLQPLCCRKSKYNFWLYLALCIWGFNQLQIKSSIF